MVRRTRKSKRMVGGKAGYATLIGTRAEVMHGTAYKTSAGKTKSQGGDSLTRANLKYNKHGRIVSVAKSAKKNKLLAQLRKAGYTTKKGEFGAVKIGSNTGRGTRKRRCRHKFGKNKGKYKKCGGSSTRRRSRRRTRRRSRRRR